MTVKRLLNVIKPSISINAFKILTGQKKISETQKRKAYILEYGSDAMEYSGDEFYD